MTVRFHLVFQIDADIVVCVKITQAISYNGHNKLMADVKPMDVTMDLLGGIDKQPDSFYGDNTRDEHVGPELGLSLKRSCSESFENQDESKLQKLSLSDDASPFSRYVCLPWKKKNVSNLWFVF